MECFECKKDLNEVDDGYKPTRLDGPCDLHLCGKCRRNEIMNSEKKFSPPREAAQQPIKVTVGGKEVKGFAEAEINFDTEHIPKQKIETITTVKNCSGCGGTHKGLKLLPIFHSCTEVKE